MFLPQAPSARATPSPLVDMPGRPAIHCAKDRSIPWHTIRIIGCGVVPFLYVYSRSLLVLYGTPFVCQCGAPREWRCMVFRSAEAASGSTALESACTRWCLLFQVTLVDRMACARFSTHWGLGFQPNTQVEFARYAPTYDTLRFTTEKSSWPGVRGEIGVAAVGVAVARATERRFINQAFVPALFARGDGTGRVSHHTRPGLVTLCAIRGRFNM